MASLLQKHTPLRLSRSPPAPPTSILMVPLGPRLVFITSASPLVALIDINLAAAPPMTSACGLSA